MPKVSPKVTQCTLFNSVYTEKDEIDFTTFNNDKPDAAGISISSSE